MNNIPEGWEASTLGGFTRQEDERVGRRNPVVLSSTKYHGLVPSSEYFKNRQIYSDNISSYRLVRRDWFAYATNHLAEGSIGLQEEHDEACVSPVYTVFSCNTSIDPRYLYRVLKSHRMISAYSVHEQASVDRRGAVRYRDFGKIPAILPPLNEQRRITEILDTADESIRSTERLLAKLREALRGLILSLVSNGSPLMLDDPLEPVGAVAEQSPGSTVIGPFGSNLTANDYRATGVPVIFVRDVHEAEFTWKSNVYVSPAKSSELAAHRIQPGDVVATKMGLPPCVAAVYPKNMPPGVITADIIRLRPNPHKVLAKWVAEYLNSEHGKAQVREITGGVTRPKITLHDFRQLLIRVPPLAEQDRICGILDKYRDNVLNVENQVTKLRRVKEGLMGDLLTGRVRVAVE